ncbi:MAG: transposase [Oscillospiraceae bacterium]|nr:transposase [Oscillospiraceae bacterium]
MRKSIRLKGYDYSSAGYYFVTVCVEDGHEMLGKVVVGDAPLRVPFIEFTQYGIFVEAQIRKINHIYPHISVDSYVVMPNHIHMLATIEDGTRRGASPTKAGIPRVVQSLKSMTTRKFGFDMWQRSYHERILRNEEEYKIRWNYINNNPAKWAEDDYFVK